MSEPLVLLPGMMCDSRLFAPQIQKFSADRHVRVADISAHAAIDALAEAVLSEAPARFALAGLSMGGIVAMEIVRLAPTRVSRLALMDTNPLAESDDLSRLRDEQISRLKTTGLRSIMRDEMKPNYLSDGPGKARILDLCMDMADALGDEVFIRQSRALQTRPDQSETLKNVTVPSLVLCGEYDTLCPVSRHELMRDLIPDSSLVIVRRAGHLPTLEQPHSTNAALAQWLRS